MPNDGETLRDEVLGAVTSLSVSRSESKVYARTEDPISSSVFDLETGARLRGSLDLSSEEVLYLVWRQKQSPRLSESALRGRWIDGRGKDGAVTCSN